MPAENFFVSFAHGSRHNPRMTGAFLNALGILLGALFGLAMTEPLSARTQNFFKNALGVAVIFFGLQMVWVGINGTFLACAKQFGIALLAVTIGNWIGRLLRLQKISNRLGRHASELIQAGQAGRKRRFADGFNACVLLFCAAPLGLMGAVADGLSGSFNLLIVKGVMDALAMMGLVRLFGWFTALSAFPVFALFGAISFVCHVHLAPVLEPRGLVDSVNVTNGFIACAVALVIFQVRKVELVNYLPALVVAPLLTWWWR